MLACVALTDCETVAVPVDDGVAACDTVEVAEPVVTCDVVATRLGDDVTDADGAWLFV